MPTCQESGPLQHPCYSGWVRKSSYQICRVTALRSCETSFNSPGNDEDTAAATDRQIWLFCIKLMLLNAKVANHEPHLSLHCSYAIAYTLVNIVVYLPLETCSAQQGFRAAIVRVSS